MKNFDMTDYYKGLKKMREYPVGKTFYMIKDNKIKPALMCEVSFVYRDPLPAKKDSKELSVRMGFTVRVDGNLWHPSLNELYETREEAAEAFLDNNEIPKKLLQVLKTEKPKTTIADLISKLSLLNPETDLEDQFWQVLQPIVEKSVGNYGQDKIETTSDYWDCECETEFIHRKEQPCCTKCGAVREDCPDSRVAEVKPENMYRG